MNLDRKSIAIGVAAGIAAALLSVGSVVHSALSIALFFVSPLPVMAAGIGWGPSAGFIAVAAAFLAVSGFAGLMPAIVIAALFTLPAAAMAHFNNLARTGADASKDWFPLSGTLFRAALMTAAGMVLAGIVVGYSPEVIRSVTDEVLGQLQSANPQSVMTDETKRVLSSFISAALPFLQPAYLFMFLVANFYLALYLTRKSGLAVRPRDFWPLALRMPRPALPLLAVALAVSFLGGTIGLIASVLTGALAAGFLMSGFAFWHAATLGKAWRMPALTASYLGLPLLQPLVLVFLLVGLYASAKPDDQATH